MSEKNKIIETGVYFTRFSVAKNFLGIIFISLPFFLFGQTAPPIEWQNTIGGNDDENLYMTIINTNGNFVIAGSSVSDSSVDKTQNTFGDWDYWLIELSQSGQIIWQCDYGGDKLDGLTSICQTDDLGYLLGGYSNSGISGNKTDSLRGVDDYWIIKVDSIGNIQWQKTIGGNDRDELNCVIKSKNSGYVVGGNSISEISGEKNDSCRGGLDDFWVLKLSDTGNIEWQKTIGGDEMDILRIIKQTSDGGYILAGESMSDSSGEKTEYSRGFFDYWILKLDSLGNILWQKTYGGNDWDAPFALEITPDHGFITAGFSYSNISGEKSENSRGFADYWVIKADSMGAMQWQKTIGGNLDDTPNAIVLTQDGGYLIGGSSISDSSGEKTENNRGISSPDYWLVKLDSLGNIEWQKTIGGDNSDNLVSIQQPIDGGYILGGFSFSPVSAEKTEMNYGGFDYWIVKLAGPLGIEQLQEAKKQFRFYPNPAFDVLTVDPLPATHGKYILAMTDMLGRQKMIMEFTRSLSVNLTDLDGGIYIATITEQGKIIQTEKVVILK